MLFTVYPIKAQTDTIYYEQGIHKFRKHWAALIPTQCIVQNAGNMGVVSIGIGWDYGKKNQWETHLLFGYIPKYQSNRGKLTTTIKENYIPWSICINNGWSVQPLTTSIYLNTVYGHEFWNTQPGRYPNKYYNFLSTKFRINIALGQRLTKKFPNNQHKSIKSISAFYELSTCDLYIRSKFIDKKIKLKDIIGLSIGVKLQFL